MTWEDSSVRSRIRPLDRTTNRQGTLVVCVLVCLLVAGSLAMATTHSALQWRRHTRIEHQLRQTELLLDAGILRAAGQLHRSADYAGETWRPSRDSVGFDSPIVEIHVTPGDQPQLRQVDVMAQIGSPLSDLARANVSSTRRSHTFTFEAVVSPQVSTPEL